MFSFLLPRAGKNLHLVSNHVGTVKPDSKLTNYVGFGALLRFLKKSLSARVSDRPKILGEFIASHSNPEICNRDRPRCFVSGDVYFKRKISLKYLVFSQLSHPQLLEGIGGVRN